MQKDQPTGPDTPRPPEFAVNFRTVPSYSASVRINGRHSDLLSRLIRPFGRLVFAWAEWRGKRARNNSRPA
jgi:hypothetical protein